MKKSNLVHLCFWSLCALLVTGCQTKSGNIWDDNQTGAYYKNKNNTSSLWDKISGKGEIAGPLEDEFVPLNEEDLKAQFAEARVPQPSKDLGEGDVPAASQFSDPAGALAGIFTPVYFNTDQHVLKNKDYLENIRKMARYLKDHPKTYVIIEGHCDERGPEQYNLALGTRRANFVRSLLIKEGAHPDQLHTISYGKDKPFESGHSPESWSKNRRAHFRVTDQR